MSDYLASLALLLAIPLAIVAAWLLEVASQVRRIRSGELDRRSPYVIGAARRWTRPPGAPICPVCGREDPNVGKLVLRAGEERGPRLCSFCYFGEDSR